jgi:hypothetical protein
MAAQQNTGHITNEDLGVGGSFTYKGFGPQDITSTLAIREAAGNNWANTQERIREFDIGQRNYEQQLADQKAAAASMGTGLSNLVNEYNRAYAQSRADNENRYNQMLGIADKTTGQQQADVISQFQKGQASGMQNLQRLGMANTTLGASLQQGVQREQSAALNRLADTMQQTKLGIIGSKKTDRELAPDSTLLQAALSQLGQTGAYGTGALGGVFGGTSAAQPSVPVAAQKSTYNPSYR